MNFNRDDFQPDPEQRAAVAARNSASEARWVEAQRANGAVVRFQNTPFGPVPVADVEV